VRLVYTPIKLSERQKVHATVSAYNLVIVTLAVGKVGGGEGINHPLEVGVNRVARGPTFPAGP